MSEPTQHGSSGRDVEAAVRNIVRGTDEPGHGPVAEERAPADAPVQVPARPPGNGRPHADSAADGAPPAEPRIVGPLEAFLRHPILTLLPLLLLLAAAVAIGTQRDPEHTAKTRIQVGRDNVPPFYLQSVISGSQALAATYARTAYTEPVVQAAARGAGVPVEDVRGNLDGSQVGGSTLIEVEARADSSRAAIAMANSAAEAMVDYVISLTRNTDQSRELFDDYRAAQRRFHEADDRVRRLLGTDRARRRPELLRRARLAADTAKLRAEDLAARYRQSTTEQMTASELDVIAPAATTESDREDVLQQLLVIGAVAGLVLGLALALLRSNWSLLRNLRRG